MSSEIRNIQPKIVWNHFADLNAVPRASKKEERVIQFMTNFGKKLNLKTAVDSVGNVFITKPATAGMENKKTIVMQSHLDMVHQKNTDTDFDFDTEGIKMYIDGDWVKAKGTTLGADNGLGVASVMAILSSADIPHPTIEALFTIDEETGMTGATGLKSNVLTGDILLNLDTEDDNEIGVGCAGGVDITASGSYKAEKIPDNTIAFEISVTDLKGGHSGMDIHKGLGNANKIMNRLLFNAGSGLYIAEINGGSLRNAIPRESFAVILVDTVSKKSFLFKLNQLISEIKHEFASSEPGLTIELKETAPPETMMESEVQKKLIQSVYGALNGVYRMSPGIENLVETSNNIAQVVVKNGIIKIGCLARSSSETNKWDLADSLRSVFELAGFNVEFSGIYPGWMPDVNSGILKVLRNLYLQMNDAFPRLIACHAGLECGILGRIYPNMDMVSLGPNIRGAHSPEEKAQISSMQKFWKYLLEILKNIPDKD